VLVSKKKKTKEEEEEETYLEEEGTDGGERTRVKGRESW